MYPDAARWVLIPPVRTQAGYYSGLDISDMARRPRVSSTRTSFRLSARDYLKQVLGVSVLVTNACVRK